MVTQVNGVGTGVWVEQESTKDRNRRWRGVAWRMLITNQSLPGTSGVDASQLDFFFWEMEGLELRSRFRRRVELITEDFWS
jgi:hypothetical protein